MNKKIVCVVLLVLFLAGGCTDPVWEKVVEAKVVKIEIIGIGGWGSPNGLRVWTLDNGMTVSMNHWRKEDVCIGDTVVKYKLITSGWERAIWRKKITKKIK